MKNDNRISSAPDAELYGGGFIIEGNQASGTFQKCSIKMTKNDGANIHLIAACLDGIVVQEMQFIVKFLGADQITLTLAGTESVESPFVVADRSGSNPKNL